jgi:type II secretory pathway predicted ATPase ExeA
MEKLEIYQVLKQFEDECIPFPPFVTAIQSVEESLMLYRETGIVERILIYGEAGSGKSTLCKAIVCRHPRYSQPDRDIVPVLAIDIPAAGNISGVAEEMLRVLGDPSPNRGTISAKTMRVVTLCRACKVELLLFDEAQHIYDRGAAATHYKVGDWLKGLVDQLNIPVVLLGLPPLQNLLQVNEQLRRRFGKRMSLALGQSETETIENECLQLFITLGNSLPVGLSPGDYSWQEMGLRLHYASDGRVHFIKRLLYSALKRALLNGGDRILPETLEQAFTDEIFWEGTGALNPFNPDFGFRRLDRANEPFQAGNFAARSRRANVNNGIPDFV